MYAHWCPVKKGRLSVAEVHAHIPVTLSICVSTIERRLAPYFLPVGSTYRPLQTTPWKPWFYLKCISWKIPPLNNMTSCAHYKCVLIIYHTILSLVWVTVVVTWNHFIFTSNRPCGITWWLPCWDMRVDHTDHLTHLPLDKMVAISQTIFSDAFSWKKSFVFWWKFHWSLFLRVQLTITQHWFR